MSIILELLKTSIIVGTLYTLTGPNLAAIATLSGTDITDHRDDDESYDSKRKRKPRHETFLLGLRWGIGNSIGLVLVGTILISLQTDASGEWVWMDDWLRTLLQVFVGLFLLVLGTYGLVKALKNRELSMSVGSKDLEFKKSSADSASLGLESAITEIVVNRIFDDGAQLSNSSSSSSEPSPPKRRMSNRSFADSIVDQMVTCLDASDVAPPPDADESLGLSEFDLRMWKAAKSLTENMMLYADDDWSYGSKSLESSIRTIDMGAGGDNDTEMAQPQSGFLSGGPVAVLTKEDDTKVPVTRMTFQDKISVTSSERSSDSSNQLCNKISRYTCYVCTPRVLAVFAGIIHGLSGPGEVLGVIPALQLKKVHLAILYLGTFCIVSTLVMGGFAAFYGGVCQWLVEKAGKKDEDASLSRVFLVEFGSACLSIVVGIIWLTLLAVGQLDIIEP